MKYAVMKIIEKLRSRNDHLWDHPPVVIACMGDSVTHGCFEVFINRHGHIDTRFDAKSGYALRLGERLQALYPVCAPSIINAGISGDNAANGLKRLERDVLRFSPDLVTVNFGLNDAMNPKVDEGVSTYARAMDGLFGRIVDAGSECLLVTPSFMCEYVSQELTDDFLIQMAHAAVTVQTESILARYVDAAREAARRRGVPIADTYARWEALKRAGVDTTAMLCNHINHPSPDAHGLFIEAILGALLDG